MQIPKEIIEKAIAGGYRRGDILDHTYTVLEPSFWQAFGLREVPCPASIALGEGFSPDCRDCKEGWISVAHRFYDIILPGGDLDTFWNELLSQPD